MQSRTQPDLFFQKRKKINKQTKSSMLTTTNGQTKAWHDHQRWFGLQDQAICVTPTDRSIEGSLSRGHRWDGDDDNDDGYDDDDYRMRSSLQSKAGGRRGRVGAAPASHTRVACHRRSSQSEGHVRSVVNEGGEGQCQTNERSSSHALPPSLPLGWTEESSSCLFK